MDPVIVLLIRVLQYILFCNFTAMGHNSAEYLHTLIEALRLSFADVFANCADPAIVPVPVKQMLDKQYAAERRKLISPDKYEFVYMFIWQ